MNSKNLFNPPLIVTNLMENKKINDKKHIEEEKTIKNSKNDLNYEGRSILVHKLQYTEIYMILLRGSIPQQPPMRF